MIRPLRPRTRSAVDEARDRAVGEHARTYRAPAARDLVRPPGASVVAREALVSSSHGLQRAWPSAAGDLAPEPSRARLRAGTWRPRRCSSRGRFARWPAATDGSLGRLGASPLAGPLAAAGARPGRAAALALDRRVATLRAGDERGSPSGCWHAPRRGVGTRRLFAVGTAAVAGSPGAEPPLTRMLSPRSRRAAATAAAARPGRRTRRFAIPAVGASLPFRGRLTIDLRPTLCGRHRELVRGDRAAPTAQAPVCAAELRAT